MINAQKAVDAAESHVRVNGYGNGNLRQLVRCEKVFAQQELIFEKLKFDVSNQPECWGTW